MQFGIRPFLESPCTLKNVTRFVEIAPIDSMGISLGIAQHADKGRWKLIAGQRLKRP